MHFLDNLGTHLTAYLAGLSESSDLQANASAVWPKIEIQGFNSRLSGDR
jgi:hypothetical protein